MTRLPMLSLLFVVVACGEPVPSGSAPPSAMKPPPKTTGSEVASAEAEEYFYNPAGKRDPFQSFIKVGRAEEERGGTWPALQRWDIDKYTLQGVIWNTARPQALLVDPEGTGHSIRVGTYVGRNWGKVTSISDGCVVVTEEYQTLDGELVVNPVTVCFPTEARK